MAFVERRIFLLRFYYTTIYIGLHDLKKLFCFVKAANRGAPGTRAIVRDEEDVDIVEPV